MRKGFTLPIVVLLAGAAPALLSPAVAQEAAASQAGRYSVDKTLVGTLLDDPAAAAILKKMIPTVYANDMFQTMGRDQTLHAIQQYEPGPLSDENLAKIQAEFDKLPAKQ